MSQRRLGMMVAITFGILTPYVSAVTQYGWGQVANLCGDCYGGSVVALESDVGSATGNDCCGQEVRFVTRMQPWP